MKWEWKPKMKDIYSFKDNCISDNASIMDALNRLDVITNKTLFVVDGDGRIQGSLTDGDVRRAILKGITLDSNIKEFARSNPFVIHRGEENRIDSLIKEKKVGIIPILDDEDRIIDIYIDKKSGKPKTNRVTIPIVIMAGGKGTRLDPYTRILPKPLIPVEGIPISERIIKSFIEFGCDEFHMILNYKKNMIRAYYNELDSGYNIRFYDEEKPLGTGGGVKLLEGVMDSTFVMTNCDILVMHDLADIIEHHRTSGNVVTMVCSLKNFEIPYGVVNIGYNGEIDSFEEKPQVSFFTNTGYYILEKEIFDYIGENEQIGMPDVVERVRKAGHKVGVYPISENSWLDMGQFDSMEIMEQRLRELQ